MKKFADTYLNYLVYLFWFIGNSVLYKIRGKDLNSFSSQLLLVSETDLKSVS